MLAQFHYIQSDAVLLNSRQLLVLMPNPRARTRLCDSLHNASSS